MSEWRDFVEGLEPDEQLLAECFSFLENDIRNIMIDATVGKTRKQDNNPLWKKYMGLRWEIAQRLNIR